LSGRTRTTSEFGSASAFGIGSSAVNLSRQCALVFNQKIWAVTLPPFAEANKEPERSRCGGGQCDDQRFRRATDEFGDVVLARFQSLIKSKSDPAKCIPYAPALVPVAAAYAARTGTTGSPSLFGSIGVRTGASNPAGRMAMTEGPLKRLFRRVGRRSLRFPICGARRLDRSASGSRGGNRSRLGGLDRHAGARWRSVARWSSRSL
jgi:hypothetical protein